MLSFLMESLSLSTISYHMKSPLAILLILLAMLHPLIGEEQQPLEESLPQFTEKDNPTTLNKIWTGWNPLYEPLEVEILHEWEEDDIVLKVIRYRVGVFKGQKAMMAGIYGYPKGKGKVPGLLQIHGGGQYADANAVLTNAKRGYATLSIAWAGRINAPDYRVSPAEVKLFWEGKTGDPAYKVTTDWGALDAYHAPSREGKDAFKSVIAEEWTLDQFPSARNISWFPLTMATRRAVTFLQEQKEVNKNRIGVYGHSMGGKLTVLTAGLDWRVSAAVPSCGGVSDRYNEDPIYAGSTHDPLFLQRITCPILFLNPVNDFHAHFSDFQTVHKEIKSSEWRYSFSPQLNHQDIPEHEVATQLWFDHFLKFKTRTPKTPKTELNLASKSGVPEFTVTPDASLPIQSIDIYYTQQGVKGKTPPKREERTSRYWRHARTLQEFGQWKANLPISDLKKPLWAYANVTYKLPQEISGAGYYYQDYTSESFTLSSEPHLISPAELQEAGVEETLSSSLEIENFQGSWEKGWFKHKGGSWQSSTHKLSSPLWQAPKGASLALEITSEEPNTVVIGIDDYWAEQKVSAGRETLLIPPRAFQNADGTALTSFQEIYTLTLTDTVNLRKKGAKEQRVLGEEWKGSDPVFQSLRWERAEGTEKASTAAPESSKNPPAYEWTTDHMHIGVRWQPHAGLPELNKTDFQRDVLSVNSSYVQLWVSWSAIEPKVENQNYAENPSGELQNIEQAVDLCHQAGKKVELVFYHCPAWATESGVAGGEQPKEGEYPAFVKRFSTYFKGRVHAYQLYHEANLDDMMKGASAEFLINELFIKGAETVREVHGDSPILISTSGMSPCIYCPPVKGLGEMGDSAINNFYDLMISNDTLMNLVDALNMNVSDQNDGYGGMNGVYINSTWDNYDLVRGKLDEAGYTHVPVIASESWITWDGAANTTYDVNRDGVKNEQDAYQKCLTIMGQCLERGLNTMNFPWSDNSSTWAMGLTKRIDYNGEVTAHDPSLTVPSLAGGPDVITQKMGLSKEEDGTLKITPGGGEIFTVEDYAVPGDPNHLHYYIWKWYSQISGGSDEVIRHAIAGEKGNDISVGGPAFSGNERYRISSYNRTKKEFKVLLYGSGCNDGPWAMFTLPAKIQTGKHYHTDQSKVDFRGEGLEDGTLFTAVVETKDISRETGRDLKVSTVTRQGTVKDGKIYFVLPSLQPFTTITIKAAE